MLKQINFKQIIFIFVVVFAVTFFIGNVALAANDGTCSDCDTNSILCGVAGYDWTINGYADGYGWPSCCGDDSDEYYNSSDNTCYGPCGNNSFSGGNEGDYSSLICNAYDGAWRYSSGSSSSNCWKVGRDEPAACCGDDSGEYTLAPSADNSTGCWYTGENCTALNNADYCCNTDNAYCIDGNGNCYGTGLKNISSTNDRTRLCVNLEPLLSIFTAGTITINTSETMNGFIDCDIIAGYGLPTCDSTCPARTVEAGESGVGEYSSWENAYPGFTSQCCGDDANEYYAELCPGVSGVDRKCCNSLTDKINASGNCVSSCNTAPNTPTNPIPANGATCIPFSTSLQFDGGDKDGASDIVIYDLTIFNNTTGDTHAHVTKALSGDTSTITFVTEQYPDFTSYNTGYTWCVQATDNHGATSNQSCWVLTTVVCNPSDACCNAGCTWYPTLTPCADTTYGSWGTCGSFTDVCDESGWQYRDETTYTCNSSHVCTANTVTNGDSIYCTRTLSCNKTCNDACDADADCPSERCITSGSFDYYESSAGLCATDTCTCSDTWTTGTCAESYASCTTNQVDCYTGTGCNTTNTVCQCLDGYEKDGTGRCDPVPSGPNLKVDDIILSSATVCQGDIVDISARISNVGDQSTISSFSNKSIVDTTVRTHSMAALAAGSSSTFSITSWNTSSVSPGTYNVYVKADYNDTIVESNETNNERTEQVTIRSVADCTDYAPNDPSNPSPAQGETCVALGRDYTFSGGDLDGASDLIDYGVVIYDSGGSVYSQYTQYDIAGSITDITFTDAQLTDLQYDSDYTWCAQAVDSTGLYSQTVCWDFHSVVCNPADACCQASGCAWETTGTTCAASTYGTWGSCTDFTDSCDATGTQYRDETTYTCDTSHSCSSSLITNGDSQSCTRSLTCSVACGHECVLDSDCSDWQCDLNINGYYYYQPRVGGTGICEASCSCNAWDSYGTCEQSYNNCAAVQVECYTGAGCDTAVDSCLCQDGYSPNGSGGCDANPSGPDLKVADIIMDSTVMQGAQVPISATISNVGDESTSISFTNQSVVNTTVRTHNMAALAAGSSSTFSVTTLDTSGLSAGVYDVTVTADSANAVAEGSETNNARTETLQVVVLGQNNTPYVPSNPNPADGSACRPVGQTLSFAGGDPDGSSNNVTYDLNITESSTSFYSSSQVASGDVTSISFSNIPFEYNKTYTWCVTATDNYGLATPEVCWDFSTAVCDPSNSCCQTDGCAWKTTGESCGLTTYGTWGDCGSFIDDCDVSGTQYRDMVERTCDATHTCITNTIPNGDSQTCNRTLSCSQACGNECDENTDCSTSQCDTYNGYDFYQTRVELCEANCACTAWGAYGTCEESFNNCTTNQVQCYTGSGCDTTDSICACQDGYYPDGSGSCLTSPSGRADLKVEDIDFTSTVCIGDLVPITATIRNIGDTNTGSSFVNQSIVNSVTRTHNMNALVAGASDVFSVTTLDTTGLSAGVYNIVVDADYNDVIFEGSEANNKRTEELTIQDCSVGSTNNGPYDPSNGIPNSSDTSITTNFSFLSGDPDVGDSVTYSIGLFDQYGTQIGWATQVNGVVTADPVTVVFTLGQLGTSLSYNTFYSWCAMATDNSGVSSDTVCWDFTTEAAPSDPIIVTGGEISVNFDWCIDGSDPRLVHFTSDGSGENGYSVSGGSTPYSYDWNFGDNTSHDTTQNADHTFIEDSAEWSVNYGGWSSRRKINIDSTYTGGALTNVPVLIKLDATNFDFTRALGNGLDIRFSDKDDNPLPFEEEYWNSGVRSAVFWVKIPSLVGGGNINDYIYIYYGHNPDPSTYPDPADVWTNDYALVQHFEEEGDNDQNTDSTSYANDTSYVSKTSVDGYISFADNFTPTSANYLIVPADPSLQNLSRYTITAWVKPDTSVGNRFIFDKKSEIRIREGNSINFRTGGVFDGAEGEWQTNTGVLNTGSWNFFSLRYNATSASNDPMIYANGSIVASASVPSGFTQDDNPTGSYDNTDNNDIYIGARNSAADYRFDGILDEYRISNTTRSLDWIDFQYCSMNQTCVVYGAEERNDPNNFTVTLTVTDDNLDTGFKEKTIDLTSGSICPNSFRFNSLTPLGSNMMSLEWNMFNALEDYNIYRNGSQISLPSITCNLNACNFTDTGLQSNTLYEYYITTPSGIYNYTDNPLCPINHDNQGIEECPLSARTGMDVGGLAVESDGCGRIKIEWDRLSDVVEGTDTTAYTYHIYRGINNTDNVIRVESNLVCDSSTCSYIDTNILPEQQYCYQIVSDLNGEESSIVNSDYGCASSYCYKAPIWEER